MRFILTKPLIQFISFPLSQHMVTRTSVSQSIIAGSANKMELKRRLLLPLLLMAALKRGILQFCTFAYCFHLSLVSYHALAKVNIFNI
jgi:hypothetical protein